MRHSTDTDQLFSITELGDQLELTPRAIRLYEAKGLLTPQRVGTTRVYTHRDRARLQIILRGKRLGFSLARIGEYLDLYDADPAQQKQLRLLLSGARKRIEQLERQRRDLELTLAELRDVEQQTLAAMDDTSLPPSAGDAAKRGTAKPRSDSTDGGPESP